MNSTPKIILLADDDLDDQEFLEEAFLHIEPDAGIHTVSSGRQLIEYLLHCQNKHLPGLIVLDYNMPDMNAAEILAYLRENDLYKNIPAVVWSTSDATLYKESCRQKGAKKYFRKPTKFEEVVKLAEEMLGFYSPISG